jgi:nucleoredoxin
MSSTPSTDAAAAAASGPSKMEQLLGNKLWIDAKGTAGNTADLFRNKQFVALYFSASWCPPCKGTYERSNAVNSLCLYLSHTPHTRISSFVTTAFSPILADFYNACAKDEQVEIVYVSSDHSLVDFTAYYGKMPWLAIPYDEPGNKIRSNLASLFQIRGIPSLIVLDVATGQYITADARNHIQQQQSSSKAWKQVIQQWKSIPPVPIDEGVAHNAPGFLQTLVMTILRNPMFLMAAFYIVKWAMRKYQQQQQQQDPSSIHTMDDPAESATADTSNVIGDDEF